MSIKEVEQWMLLERCKEIKRKYEGINVSINTIFMLEQEDAVTSITKISSFRECFGLYVYKVELTNEVEFYFYCAD